MADPVIHDGEDDNDYVDLTPYLAARREADQDSRAPGFRLHGELYVCVDELLAAPLLDLEVRSRTHGRTVGLYEFLGDVLTPESWAQFEKAFRDPERPITLEVLDDCVTEVLRQFTARPTKGSSSSPGTRSTRGRSSKGGSAKKVPARRSR